MRLVTPHYRVLNLVVFGLVALAIIGGLTGPDAPPGNDDWIAWAMLAVDLILALRAVRLGITVTADTVIVRSWFITRRIARRDLLHARAVRYDGFWTGQSETSWLNQLELEIRGRAEPRTVRAVVATRRSRRIQRIAHQLRKLSQEAREPR